jgi:membrane protease YdiL (CAAX protease family)
MQHMVVRDTLIQLSVQSLAFVAVGAAVYVLTRVLGFRYRTWPFASARDSSLWGIAAVLIGWMLVSMLCLLVARRQDTPQEPLGDRQYNANDVVSQAILALIAFGPALLVMRRRRESWASAGVSAHNLGRSLMTGILLIALSTAAGMLLGKRSFGEMASGLTVSHFWALLQYAIVGFGEEFAFRGYLQTRLMAWLGRWQGWVVTSVLMALAHVVQRITMVGLLPLEAVLSSASLIPISLLLGYMMLRTENVVAPGLFHTFANWVGTLG